MTPADLAEVVRIHMTAFPGFFLTSLGTTFLSLFYGETIRLRAIAIVAVWDGLVVGFAVGSESPRGFYRRVITRRMVHFAFAALPVVVRRPQIARRLLRSAAIVRSAHVGGEATLMSIAVDLGEQHHGVGKQLVQSFLAAARSRGAHSVNLLTERDANDAVNAFYRRQGFRLARELDVGGGRVMNEYQVELLDR